MFFSEHGVIPSFRDQIFFYLYHIISVYHSQFALLLLPSEILQTEFEYSFAIVVIISSYISLGVHFLLLIMSGILAIDHINNPVACFIFLSRLKFSSTFFYKQQSSMVLFPGLRFYVTTSLVSSF